MKYVNARVLKHRIWGQYVDNILVFQFHKKDMLHVLVRIISDREVSLMITHRTPFEGETRYTCQNHHNYLAIWSYGNFFTGTQE